MFSLFLFYFLKLKNKYLQCSLRLLFLKYRQHNHKSIKSESLLFVSIFPLLETGIN